MAQRVDHTDGDDGDVTHIQRAADGYQRQRRDRWRERREGADAGQSQRSSGRPERHHQYRHESAGNGHAEWHTDAGYRRHRHGNVSAI